MIHTSLRSFGAAQMPENHEQVDRLEKQNPLRCLESTHGEVDLEEHRQDYLGLTIPLLTRGQGRGSVSIQRCHRSLCSFCS